MTDINRLVKEIVNKAEKSDDFYEVEVSVHVRLAGGLRSEFFRAQSQCPLEPKDDSDIDYKNPVKWM
ncbi:hypothetical protein [Marinobacter sp.]|uniref:hypothetical protein n=1 Tax=Marinobacter sp. TaxID=50741 RepID=UPI003A8DD494